MTTGSHVDDLDPCLRDDGERLCKYESDCPEHSTCTVCGYGRPVSMDEALGDMFGVFTGASHDPSRDCTCQDAR